MKRITYLIALLFLGFGWIGEARTSKSPYPEILESNSAECEKNGDKMNIGVGNKYFLEIANFRDCIFPKGISPNNDGLNDKFDLSCLNVTKLEIFNRNGTLVYSKENYTDEWFGQTNKGDNLPVGTYFYTAIYEGGDKTHSDWVYISR